MCMKHALVLFSDDATSYFELLVNLIVFFFLFKLALLYFSVARGEGKDHLVIRLKRINHFFGMAYAYQTNFN